MPADIILYALIAAGLVFWLRNILGTRHGDERERPNPYVGAPERVGERGPDGAPVTGETEVTPQDRIIELAKTPTPTMSVDNKTAELGLLDIAKADKKFEIREFLTAAQDAFAYVVEAFAQGDRETLQGLLAPNVYEAFDTALKQRELDGQVMETEIRAIRKSQVLKARLEKRNAFITVRFVADEFSVTRDQDGDIIAGNPDKTTQMIDVWTFTRDIKSRDPRWLVCETRSDDPDDNDKIPDTH